MVALRMEPPTDRMVAPMTPNDADYEVTPKDTKTLVRCQPRGYWSEWDQDFDEVCEEMKTRREGYGLARYEDEIVQVRVIRRAMISTRVHVTPALQKNRASDQEVSPDDTSEP